MIPLAWTEGHFDERIPRKQLARRGPVDTTKECPRQNPSHGERRILPPEKIRRKRNGEVGHQHESKHYSEEFKAGYQEADIADRAGQEMKGRQQVNPSARSLHKSRISVQQSVRPLLAEHCVRWTYRRITGQVTY
jgi:hypothetical protein